MQTRRNFISCTACTVIALGCGESVEPDIPIDTGDTGALPDFDPCEGELDDSWMEIALSSVPSLEEVGAFIYHSIAGKTLLIAHVIQGCYVAVDQNCTHEGEVIIYQSQADRFVCPRHAATFSWNGSVIAGPTAIPLESYPIVLEEESLWIKI